MHTVVFANCGSAQISPPQRGLPDCPSWSRLPLHPPPNYLWSRSEFSAHGSIWQRALVCSLLDSQPLEQCLAQRSCSDIRWMNDSPLTLKPIVSWDAWLSEDAEVLHIHILKTASPPPLRMKERKKSQAPWPNSLLPLSTHFCSHQPPCDTLNSAVKNGNFTPASLCKAGGHINKHPHSLQAAL